jgi:hypothetical protein
MPTSISELTHQGHHQWSRIMPVMPRLSLDS